MAERERRLREEEAVAARRGPRVILDPKGGTAPTDREGRSPCAKRARGDTDDGGQAKGHQRRVEERGGPPAPARSWQRQIGVRSPRCRGFLRGMWRGGGRQRFGGGGQSRWWSEVGGEGEKGTPAQNPPVPVPGAEGREAAGQGAGDGGGQVEEDARGSAARVGRGRCKEKGEKAQGADAEGAAAGGGVVLREAEDEGPAGRGAEGREAVQGYMMMNLDWVPRFHKATRCDRDEGSHQSALRMREAPTIAVLGLTVSTQGGRGLGGATGGGAARGAGRAGGAADQEVERMVPFLDVAPFARLVLQRYALVLDINVADTEHMGSLDRQLTRAMHGKACKSGLYGLLCLLRLRELGVDFCETLEGVGIHMEDQGLDDRVVVTAQASAHDNRLRMPDLLGQPDRHICVTPRILFESVAWAGTRPRLHEVAAWQPCKHFVQHYAQQTVRRMWHINGTNKRVVTAPVEIRGGVNAQGTGGFGAKVQPEVRYNWLSIYPFGPDSWPFCLKGSNPQGRSEGWGWAMAGSGACRPAPRSGS